MDRKKRKCTSFVLKLTYILNTLQNPTNIYTQWICMKDNNNERDDDNRNIK